MSAASELEELQEQNVEKLEKLQRMGVSLNDLQILSLKVNLLFKHCVPKSKRVAFDREWNEIMEQLLDSALAQVARAQLTQGVSEEGKQLTLL